MPGQDLQKRRLATARVTFLACLAYMVLVTLIWIVLNLTGMEGGSLFGNYRVTVEIAIRVAIGFVVFWFFWSWAFYRLKRFLLKRIGFDNHALEQVFASRLEGFELEELLASRSERAIRIVDMIGRRSRTVAMVALGFFFMYKAIGQDPRPESLAMGLESNLLESIAFGWWGIVTYHMNGFLGRVSFGAHARVMDGVQARANVLCIATLWNAFKFVMIPIGFQLALVFPPERYAAVFGLIWLSYAACDFASEIVGSLVGRQVLRVWGLGDVNRKSVAGTVAGFVSGLAVSLLIVNADGLGAAWYGLAVVIAVVNTLVELYSPRGTDDFTMATCNALVCWAFGALALGV